MRAMLEFQLPEEKEMFEEAVRAGRTAARLDEFRNWLRNRYKHGPAASSASAEISDVYEQFLELFPWEEE